MLNFRIIEEESNKTDSKLIDLVRVGNLEE
jgi:hypothetical protein